MTEIEARDLFGPFDDDEDKVTPEMRSTANETMKKITQAVKSKEEDLVYIENVNHPTHYNTGEVECIDAIQSCMCGLNGFEGFCVGNAIKYLWRWKHKGGVDDLHKAHWYLVRLIKSQEG